MKREHDVNWDMNLRWSRRLSMIPRWSVLPVLKKQTVADHTYQVCQISRLLMTYHVERDNPEFWANTLVQALDHDLEEAAIGDAPSSAKKPKNYKELARTKGQTYLIVKLADIIEALCFLQEEALLGNYWTNEGVVGKYNQEIADIWPNIHFVKDMCHPSVLLDFIYKSVKGTHPALERGPCNA